MHQQDGLLSQFADGGGKLFGDQRPIDAWRQWADRYQPPHACATARSLIAQKMKAIHRCARKTPCHARVLIKNPLQFFTRNAKKDTMCRYENGRAMRLAVEHCSFTEGIARAQHFFNHRSASHRAAHTRFAPPAYDKENGIWRIAFAKKDRSFTIFSDSGLGEETIEGPSREE